MAQNTSRLLVALIALALGAGLFLLGRVTSNADDRYAAGRSAGYYSGLRQGESRGVQEGRSLQFATSLPEDSREALRASFDAGYTAGANDTFGGYDGGWYVSTPYLITLAKGSGAITYDLSSRTLLHGDTDYFLCPNTQKICHRPHR